MVAKDELGEGLVRKSTQIVTNVPELRDILCRRCPGGHRHVHLMNGRAKDAAVYPEQLCRTVTRGVRLWQGRLREGLGYEVFSFDRPDLCDPAEARVLDGVPLLDFHRADLCDPNETDPNDCNGYYLDDIKGDRLDPKLARAARLEEVQVFQDRRVYTVVPRSSMPKGKRCIGTRWVETNKGTESAPKVRSRLVCQEFAFGGDPGGDLFAPTPPLGATRFLLSGLASRSRWGLTGHRAMLLDFKRAFLYGDVERELYVELPEEEAGRQGGQNVGRLRKAMYGTRDAPAVWQRLVRKVMLRLGFKPSTTTPCVYWNRRRQLRVVAHVDDFLVTGPKQELIRLRSDSKRDYDVDGDIIGPGADEAREGKFLGRMVRYCSWGMELVADSRLVQVLLSEFDGDSKAEAETPGFKPDLVSSGVAMSAGDALDFAVAQRN